MRNQENKLEKEFNGARLFIFALPTIAMMVFLGLYTVIDTIFVARFVSTDALAAINVVTPVIGLTVGIGTMLAAGGNAIISRNMGEGEEHQARENFTLILLSSAAAGIVFEGVCSIWLTDILHVLGAEGSLFHYAKDYLDMLLPFIPAYMLQTVFANLFVTAGRPGLGSVLSIGAGALNLILDYIFIVICGMEIRGAALGTGCGYLLPALVGVIFFLFEKRGTLFFCRPRFRMKVIAESCLNGSSEMVGQSASAVTTLLFNLSMLRLAGEDGVAAVTILNYCHFLFHAFYIGFSMGIAPMIGFHHGSRNDMRQKKILASCFRFIAAASGILFLLSFFGSHVIAEIFAGSSDDVCQMVGRGLRLFSSGFLFSGWNIFASSMFTALSNGKVSAVLSFLRTFVLLAATILIMPRFLGITGVWLAVPTTEVLAFFVAVGLMGKTYKAL